jgi:GYF domain 2
MADKQWYIKVGGTQQGPYSEAELRDLIARTEISADTLVWRNPMPE